MAIKAADVSNPTRPLEISRTWSEHIMEEFFRQGVCGYILSPTIYMYSTCSYSFIVLHMHMYMHYIILMYMYMYTCI